MAEINAVHVINIIQNIPNASHPVVLEGCGIWLVVGIWLEVIAALVIAAAVEKEAVVGSGINVTIWSNK